MGRIPEHNIAQMTLMENKGRVVSREKLMAALWETDCFVDENTLSVNAAFYTAGLEFSEPFEAGQAAGWSGAQLLAHGGGVRIYP